MLLNLKNQGKIPENTYRKLHSSDAIPSAIRGSIKHHKVGSPLRPIVYLYPCRAWILIIAAIAAIAVEGQQNAVDYCCNNGNFLPYSVIFILFTMHYYFDTWIQMLIKSCINYYFSLSFLRKKRLKITNFPDTIYIYKKPQLGLHNLPTTWRLGVFHTHNPLLAPPLPVLTFIGGNAGMPEVAGGKGWDLLSEGHIF
jgi:hypothetical protein